MVKEIFVKTILNKHKVRDSWFLDDYSLNPYEACAFNCVFCYIRGSKYGDNMQKVLSVKVNACQLLEEELLRKARKGEHGFIATSPSTEAWQPIEEKYQLTRKLMKTVLRYRFPVHVLTKSKLVLRDLDILRKIDEKAILPRDLRNKLDHGVLITSSLSTLDAKIAKIFEPGAPPPRERLETMQRCKENGFFTGVAYIPVLPFISDDEEQLEAMIRIAKEYGADYVFVGALTLFGVGRKFYYRILDSHFPDLLPKYRKLFKTFNQPGKEYQQELGKKAIKFCKKYNIKYKIILG